MLRSLVGSEMCIRDRLGVYVGADQTQDPLQKQLQMDFEAALQVAYIELQSKNVPFEVVYISRDDNLGAFNHHRQSMPWLTLPFGDRRCDDLLQRFGISSSPQPRFLTVDAGGNTLNGEAELSLLEYGAPAYPWLQDKGPLYVLSENFFEGQVQRRPAVLLLAEGMEKHDQRSAKEKLLNVAKPFVGSGIVFGYGFVETAVTHKVREFVGVSSKPALVLTDMPNNRKYICEVCSGGEMDEINILNFIKQYAKKQLPPYVKSAPRPLGDVDAMRPGIQPVVASSVQELVFDAADHVVLAVIQGDHPGWMLQVSCVLQAGPVAIRRVRFGELDSSCNDLDPRLEELGKPVPFVCLYKPGSKLHSDEASTGELCVHTGPLEPLAILHWLDLELNNQEESEEEAAPIEDLFDLKTAEEQLQVIEEEANHELKKMNMTAFTEMFHALDPAAQPTLQQLLKCLQQEESDEAGELTSLLSKVDQNNSAPEHAVSLEQWLQFWSDMLDLQGALSPEDLSDLQRLFTETNRIESEEDEEVGRSPEPSLL
eukprot:TRINITY_DN21953_c0_g1_i5.p1 TRINITY_DN21953_c0_g1~~TRINITY_DN21953_c0_g1_i5.p1  ORF type:complete len:540 (-),score=129.57 TRINITY_DN21953_c0_g1_i5:341-1960(-)